MSQGDSLPQTGHTGRLPETQLLHIYSPFAPFLLLVRESSDKFPFISWSRRHEKMGPAHAPTEALHINVFQDPGNRITTVGTAGVQWDAKSEATVWGLCRITILEPDLAIPLWPESKQPNSVCITAMCLIPDFKSGGSESPYNERHFKGQHSVGVSPSWYIKIALISMRTLHE